MPGSDLVQSVARSLDILEMAARAEDGMTLQEIAQALGLAPPTAHNLARTLVLRGYLEKTSRPTHYRLGPAVTELLQAHSHRTLLQQAAAAMQQLTAAMPAATITLVEARGGELHVALRMSPERPGVLQRPAGQTMNAYISAAGLVYQAFWTEAERVAYRHRYPFDEYGAHAWSSLDALDAAIVEVRRAGYAVPADTRGLFRVSVPVFSAGHTLAATLGLSLPTLADASQRAAIIAHMLAATIPFTGASSTC